MMFSDSRQDAAFFAPFMDNTYNKFKQRRYLVEALKNEAASIDLQEWAQRVKKVAQNWGEWDEESSDARAMPFAPSPTSPSQMAAAASPKPMKPIFGALMGSPFRTGPRTGSGRCGLPPAAAG